MTRSTTEVEGCGLWRCSLLVVQSSGSQMVKVQNPQIFPCQEVATQLNRMIKILQQYTLHVQGHNPYMNKKYTIKYLNLCILKFL